MRRVPFLLATFWSTTNFILAATNDGPKGHPLEVYNGSGSGNYVSGETVTITGTRPASNTAPVGAEAPAPTDQPNDWVFLRWFKKEGSGTIENPSEETTTLTMAGKKTVVIAVYGKIDAWFPPGKETTTKGLLLPKNPQAQEQFRLEHRTRVTISMVEGSNILSPAKVWEQIRVSLGWFPSQECVGIWHSSELVKYWDKSSQGTELSKDDSIPRSQFEEKSPGVYEASVWYEGNWTMEELPSKVDEDKNPVMPKALTGFGLVIHAVNYANTRQGTHGTLTPVDLAVDANRDGVIRFEGNSRSTDPHFAGKPLDKTTETRPFRFWVNDDDDYSVGVGGAETGEHVPVQRKDWDDAGGVGVIDGKRDLEDLTRMWIYIGGLQDAFNSRSILIGMRWKNTGHTHPAINVYRASASDGSDGYLKTENSASAQMKNGFAAAQIKVEGTTPVVFPSDADTWAGLSEASQSKYFLFEGCSEGKGQLIITIQKPDGTLIGEIPSVWLDIKNIKKMYMRPDSALPNHPWENVQFEADPTEDKENAIIFVHGWRMSPEGAGNYAEIMYKRLWQRGYKGRFAAFHWNTYWSNNWGWVPYVGGGIDAYLANFNDSEYIAWNSASALKEFVDNLPFQNRHLIAHSMGNIVVGEALRQGMAIRNYALLNAAVPAACYDEDEERIKQTNLSVQQAGPLSFTMWDSPTPDSDTDSVTKSLAYRGTFKDIGASATLINFYLPDDYATSFAWEVNNDQTKPPMYIGESGNGSLCTNFEYDPNGQSGHRLWKFMISSLYPSYYITYKPEAMAYGCRTWGKAVGAFGNTQGAIGPDSKVDMSNPANVGGGSKGFDTEHSAEFNFRIQQLHPFYEMLLDKFEIATNP